MILQGFLLWIGMSVLITTIGNLIFRFSYFQQDLKKISDLKLIIVLILSEIASISYVLFNQTAGIFSLWGINFYPIEDAVFSGFLIWGGADVLYQIYTTILSYKERIKADTEGMKMAQKLLEEDLKNEMGR